MIYLKTYEELKSKFKIGDYVRIKKGKSFPQYQNVVFKTISVENEDILGGLWKIKSEKDDDILFFYADKLVKLTKNDIKNHLIKKDTDKFNL